MWVQWWCLEMGPSRRFVWNGHHLFDLMIIRFRFFLYFFFKKRKRRKEVEIPLASTRRTQSNTGTNPTNRLKQRRRIEPQPPYQLWSSRWKTLRILLWHLTVTHRTLSSHRTFFSYEIDNSYLSDIPTLGNKLVNNMHF